MKQYVIHIATQFHTHLVCRYANQEEGNYSAETFRKKFLRELDNQEWWDDNSKTITLDFANVKTLSPTWANEAFAYYVGFVDTALILRKIILTNISQVKRQIIVDELDIASGAPEFEDNLP